MATTVKYVHHGNEQACNARRGFAQMQLDQLLEAMQKQGLKQSTSTINFADGTVITCTSTMGANVVEITVPSVVPEEQEEKLDKFTGKDVWIAYNCDKDAQKQDVKDEDGNVLDTEGWAWDIDTGDQIPRYTLDRPSVNGDPFNWNSNDDSRVNLLKSYTFNTNITANRDGSFDVKECLAFFHTKSVNIRAIKYPPDYNLSMAHNESIEVWGIENGTAAVIASCFGKACNFYVLPSGKFFLVTLNFSLKTDPLWISDPTKNYGMYIAAVVRAEYYDTDGSLIAGDLTGFDEGFLEEYSPTSWVNQTSTTERNRTWSSINNIFQSVACSDTHIYVGGTLAIQPQDGGVDVIQFQDSSFVTHDKVTFHDFDPVSMGLKSFSSMAGTVDESSPVNQPTVIQAGQIPCDGQFWTTGTLWSVPNPYRYHYGIDCGGAGMWDLEDRGSNYGAIERTKTFTTTLGTKLPGSEIWPCCYVWQTSVWDDTGPPYDNPVYTNGRILETYPSTPTLSPVPTNSFCGLLLWYDYAHEDWNAIDLVVFTSFDGISGTKGTKKEVYKVCDKFGAVDSGTVYTPDQTVTYLGSGKVMAPWQYDGENYWWIDFTPSYTGEPWDYVLHSTTGPDMITQAVTSIPNFSMHYTVGGYRKLHTTDAYENKRDIFDMIAVFSQKVLCDNDTEKSVVNKYKNFNREEKTSTVPGKHAKWCTNGKILNVKKIMLDTTRGD